MNKSMGDGSRKISELPNHILGIIYLLMHGYLYMINLVINTVLILNIL